MMQTRSGPCLGATRWRPPREAFEAVADHEGRVFHPPVTYVGEHPHPKLGSLADGAGYNPRMSFSPAKLTPIAAPSAPLSTKESQAERPAPFSDHVA